MRTLILALLVYVVLADRVTHLPGYGDVDENWFSGYMRVTSQNQKNGSMYYWFFEGPKDAPVVVWFNGGPGCSSLIGCFAELGPLQIQEDCYTIKRNKNSWTNVAHMLFIDQPIGTGYSYADGVEHFTENQSEIVDHLYSTLQQFFEKHPEFDTDLYLAGESYAGKYIPSLAERIVQVGNVGKGQLKGIIIGDGLIDPIIQRTIKPEQAYWGGLVGLNQRKQLQMLQAKCVRHIQLGKTNQIDGPCDELKSVMILYSGIINVYDLRRFDPSTNKTRIEIYLNKKEVKEALHVEDIDPHKHRYTTCSKTVVYMHLKYDILLSVKELLPMLAKHMRVYIYNGNFDLQDGPVGSEQALYTLDLPDFKRAKRDLWFVKDRVAGYSQEAGNMTLLTVHGAGHFVPTDQPTAALDMLQHFITGKLFCEKDQVIPVTHSTLTPAEFDKYLETDPNTNKTLLPCNIQQVGCKIICLNGECEDGICKCKPNWTGEDCGTVITPLQRIARTTLLPQEWRFFKFKASSTRRNMIIDVKADNTTVIPESGKHFAGHGFGVDSPTRLCVYISEAPRLPTHLDFLHVLCGTGTASFVAPKGDGYVGIFNGARHGTKVVLRSSFVHKSVARYAFHVAFNTKFFMLTGSVIVVVAVIMILVTTLGRKKPKTE